MVLNLRLARPSPKRSRGGLKGKERQSQLEKRSEEVPWLCLNGNLLENRSEINKINLNGRWSSEKGGFLGARGYHWICLKYRPGRDLL